MQAGADDAQDNLLQVAIGVITATVTVTIAKSFLLTSIGQASGMRLPRPIERMCDLCALLCTTACPITGLLSLSMKANGF